MNQRAVVTVTIHIFGTDRSLLFEKRTSRVCLLENGGRNVTVSSLPQGRRGLHWFNYEFCTAAVFLKIIWGHLFESWTRRWLFKRINTDLSDLTNALGHGLNEEREGYSYLVKTQNCISLKYSQGFLKKAECERKPEEMSEKSTINTHFLSWLCLQDDSVFSRNWQPKEPRLL